MSTDKKTIGILSENLTALQELVESGNFSSEIDAAKFAMAHAIKSGVTASTSDGSDTKWNVGTVDPDGKLREMLGIFYPNVTEPYRLLEFLMNTGLTDIVGKKGRSPDVYGIMFS